MPYLIDGHNLIPHIPGLNLHALDDERELIELLRVFSRASGKRLEIFFDKAAPGRSTRLRFGPVTAHFIRQGGTADAAIQARLKQLDRQAPNWTVVSSDREVQDAARRARAKTQSAAEFASQILALKGASKEGLNAEGGLSEAEVAAWLKIFEEDS